MSQCSYFSKSTLIGSELPPAKVAGNSVLVMESEPLFPSSELYPGLEDTAESRTFSKRSSGLWLIFLIQRVQWDALEIGSFLGRHRM